MPDPIVAYCGASRDLSLTAYDPDTGAAWTSRWASDDTLAAVVWPGDDLAATFTPTAAWVSATAGTYTVKWSGAATSSVAPGTYKLRVSATDISDSNRVHVLHEAWLKLLPSQGSGTAGAVYTTYDEILQWGPDFLDGLMTSKDQAGFREQRAAARKWIDQAIQNHYRRDTTIPRQSSLDHMLYGTGTRYPVHDVQLQAWLDDDRLVLTTPAGAAIKQAAAYYAISLVCEGQIGVGETASTYRDLAKRYRGMAGNTLRQVTAEIDTTTVKDGVGDLLVDLSVVDRIRS